jgi:hypothetical protein
MAFFHNLLKALVMMWGYITFCSMMPAGAGGAAAADVDSDEEEEEEEPWKSNPTHKARSNSPLKRPSRSSEVRGMIRRLAPDHPKIKDGCTRACAVEGCCSFFELKKTKGSWVTTKGVNHVKKFYPISALGVEYFTADKKADVHDRGRGRVRNEKTRNEMRVGNALFSPVVATAVATGCNRGRKLPVCASPVAPAVATAELAPARLQPRLLLKSSERTSLKIFLLAIFVDYCT